MNRSLWSRFVWWWNYDFYFADLAYYFAFLFVGFGLGFAGRQLWSEILKFAPQVHQFFHPC